MKFLEKIQNLPVQKRKIILWSLSAILALVLIVFFVKKTQKNFKEFEMGDFKDRLGIPELQKEIEGGLQNLEISETEGPTSSENNENVEK